MIRRILLGTVMLSAIVWGATRAPLTTKADAQSLGLQALTPKKAAKTAWTTVAPGVGMRTFRTTISTADLPTEITAFRVRPNRIKVAGGALLDANGWRRKYRAIAAVNGGYFNADNKSLGLRISDNRRTHDLRMADWGVFLIESNRARIIHTSDYRALRERGRTRRVLEAIQCGPRLVVNNSFTKLKQQWARRSAIGVDRDGFVIVAVADGQLSFAGWQRVWRDTLRCPNALNLDGGGSTQLSLRTQNFSREIGGFTPVPDAIVIR